MEVMAEKNHDKRRWRTQYVSDNPDHVLLLKVTA